MVEKAWTRTRRIQLMCLNYFVYNRKRKFIKVEGLSP